jgi:curved DNA-binding protein CbpA
MQTNKDLYKLLGLPTEASQDDIQQAHRKLVRKYHPDANPEDPRAEGRFKEVQQAYEVLSDEKKRREYDEGPRTSSRGRSPGRSRSRESSSRPRTRAGGRAGVDTTYTSSGQASHDRGPLFSLGYLLGIALVTLVIALLVLLVLGLN